MNPTIIPSFLSCIFRLKIHVVLASTLLSLLLSSCGILGPKKVARKDKKVLIVGAGLSGLSAAHYLKKNGYKPIVLEARDRIGGRIKTEEDSSFIFEHGASWIHGPKGNPVSKLAKRADARTYKTDDENLIVYNKNGRRVPEELLDREEEKLYRILDNRLGESSKSFAQVLYAQYPEYKKDPLWQYMLSAYLQFDIGTDIENLSSQDFYDDEEFRGEDLIITNGVNQLCNVIARDLDIRLNTVVEEIDYSGDSVKLVTSKGAFTASSVIVTVPLGVLKSGKLSFKPQLPETYKAAIQNLGMGTVNKYLLIWDSVFWDKNLQYIGYTGSRMGEFDYFMNLLKFSTTKGLMTFDYGSSSLQNESETDSEILKRILKNLRAIYGDSVSEPVLFKRTRWHSDPFSKGSYSYASVKSGSEAFRVFEKPVDNKIFFAGEHTSKEYRGTLHGAWLSGIQSSKTLLKSR